MLVSQVLVKVYFLCVLYRLYVVVESLYNVVGQFRSYHFLTQVFLQIHALIIVAERNSETGGFSELAKVDSLVD